MNCQNVKIISRIIGNFGVAFFAPLVGGNVANSIFPDCLSFEQTILISFIAALITTGLAISKEAAQYGEERKKI